MAHWRSIAFTALALAAFGTAQAETLKVEGASAFGGDGRPTRGMTQANVESRYGKPVAVKAAVGDPPITRWEYQNMVVYFEYYRVIQEVMKR